MRLEASGPRGPLAAASAGREPSAAALASALAWPVVYVGGVSGVLVAMAFGLCGGVALAAVYGLMMGALRLRANGLLAPWLAHLGADLVIAAILLAARP